MRHPKPTLLRLCAHLFLYHNMSLNFFKTKPAKTDASLDYKAVLDNLHVMDTAATASLDVDQFVQSEHILLGKHQGRERSDSG